MGPVEAEIWPSKSDGLVLRAKGASPGLSWEQAIECFNELHDSMSVLGKAVVGIWLSVFVKACTENLAVRFKCKFSDRFLLCSSFRKINMNKCCGHLHSFRGVFKIYYLQLMMSIISSYVLWSLSFLSDSCTSSLLSDSDHHSLISGRGIYFWHAGQNVQPDILSP